MAVTIGMCHFHPWIMDEDTLKGLIGLFKAVRLLGVEPRCESSCLNQSPPLIHHPSLLRVYNLPSVNNFKLLM